MTSFDLERRIADYYADDTARAPDRVLWAVLDGVDQTTQRHVVFHGPRRAPIMHGYAKLAAAAIAVIAIGAIGLAMFAPQTSGPGTVSAPPSTTPSVAITAAPGPSTAPALVGSFTSAMHGISIAYPEGWQIRAATVPVSAEPQGFDSPATDVIYDPTLEAHLFIALHSEALDGRTGEAWMATSRRTTGETCDTPTVRFTFEGAEGQGCGSDVVWAWTADRGYVIRLYRSPDDPWLGDIYDDAYFEGLLDTVRLDPSAAVTTAPSTSP